MKFCILIEISKEKISFLYNRSDGESKFAPFVGDGLALPLAVYCYGNDIQIGQYAIDEAKNKNPNAYTNVFQTMTKTGTYKYKGYEYHYNTLLKNAIEKYLAQFFDSVLFGQCGRLEDNIATMPICFVFKSDINENERLFVRDCFANSGYGNIGTIDYDQIVVEASTFSTKYAACVTSDGSDLFMSLYEAATQKYLGNAVIKNCGKDPRVNIAAEKLWQSLGYDNYYLDQEIERPILTKVAEEFLSSDELEFQQNVVFSDGQTRECFLSMRELDDYRYNDDGKIVADLKNLLKKQDISPLDCTIVMEGKAANNKFFERIFNEEFSSLMNVNESFHTKVVSQLLCNIKEYDYRFKSAPTSTPPRPSGPSVPSGPSGIDPGPSVDPKKYQREVRKMIAEIKGKIRVKNFGEATTLAHSLLDSLHKLKIDSWDKDIHSLLEEIPKEDPKKEPEPKEEPKCPPKEETKEDPKKYQREVRRQIADAKAAIRKGDMRTAEKMLKTLKKAMNNKGFSLFDKEIDAALASAQPPQHASASKSESTKTATKKLAGSEQLLAAGQFSEAKRAFASEGNSAMAQLCSELIKSKRTISSYQSELEAAIRNRNKSVATKAVRELTTLLATYQKYGICSTELKQLINNYKTI